MKRILSWLISNSPALNLLMIAVFVLGAFAATKLRRETFPDFDMEMIMISVPYPGATPEEVERLICQKIEEALQSIDGIKKIESSANEGSGSVVVELKSSVTNVDRTLNEVRDAIERIPSFPELAERPIVQRAKMQETIISIGVLGPGDHSEQSMLALRDVAESLRNDLVQRPGISLVNLVGTKDYQIDIEIPEQTLRSHKLSLNDAAKIISQENVQSPGGTIRSPSQEINVRTDNRRYDAAGIGQLPLITLRDGSVLTVDDVAFVRDEFTDGPALATVYSPSEDGPADPETGEIPSRSVIALGVQRNTNEDLLKMVDEVLRFVAEKNAPGVLPEGYSLVTWGDRSQEVRSRIELLWVNGFEGLLIVFILLAMFLDIKLAFWVSLGIPFSMCATALFMYGNGMTLNMISTFGLIMALGIIVDDSIMTGENIYAHRMKGKSYFQAAIDGTAEIFPAVFSSVLTTMIAFSPLLFVSGMLGKIIYALPVIMIVMLASSLTECFCILPPHLAHKTNLFFKMLHGYLYIFSWLLVPVNWITMYSSKSMDYVIERIYMPALRFIFNWRSTFLTACFCILAYSVTLVMTGAIPFTFFPKNDGNDVNVSLSFPNGTPADVTDKWTRHIETSFWRVINEMEKESGVQSSWLQSSRAPEKNEQPRRLFSSGLASDSRDGCPPENRIAVRSFRVVGMSLNSRGRNMGGSSGGGSGHSGGVQVELVPGDDRKFTSMEIAERWREAVGTIPGAEKLSFATQMFGPPGSGIEIKLVARSENSENLEAAVEECKTHLASYAGAKDITDSDVPGKWEFRLRIKDNALAMGVHPADLANTIRAVYYGAEVQRLQRGRHEVKLMVCYPREDRRSLADFNEIRIRTSNGQEYPITELAEIDVVRGYTTIQRRNQQRSVTVSADVEESVGNSAEIVADLRSNFLPALFAKYPGVSVVWEGGEEMRAESNDSMKIGFSIALCAMFVLLSLQFRSFVQPLIVMLIIPFGFVGALIAHVLAGVTFCQFSVFGLIALSGIVINDSIVLIDFINQKIREGAPVYETLIECGKRRFRPIMLTSITTIGGLLPIVLETSFQAQMIIPMALSISGGVAFTLLLVLFFIPVLYSYYVQFLLLCGKDIRGVVAHDYDEMALEAVN